MHLRFVYSSKELIHVQKSQFIEIDHNLEKIYFYGHARNHDGSIVLDINKDSISKIKSNISNYSGRFCIVSLDEEKLSIHTDKRSKFEVYYTERTDGVEISSDLSFLKEYESPQLNQAALASMFLIYGSRPPKKDTLYKDVNKLGVNESLIIQGSKLTTQSTPPALINSNPCFGKSELEKYTDIFLEALRANADDHSNIVLLSSGWDSTSILAGLVHVLGKNKVKAVIGKATLADRSGVSNPYEIARAKKFAEYYDVEIFESPLDYSTKDSCEQDFMDLKDFFKANQFYNHTGFNHWKLLKKTSEIIGDSGMVFAGEISDGIHNLGFSQYVNIYHSKSYDFREYSDKMMSYLYSPSFLDQVENGLHEDDPIWKIFKVFRPDQIIDKIDNNFARTKEDFLASFFLTGGRFPFYSLDNYQSLSNEGREHFRAKYINKYIKDPAASLNQDNFYSTFFHLYYSFHWQCSTVITLDYIADHFGVKSCIPYGDDNLFDVLSQMPESFGRGLELKSTKYPLKWMLKNKLDYPMDFQAGAHSYLYDTDPTFNHTAELMYGSCMRDIFISNLDHASIIDRMDPNLFNKKYFESIVSDYKTGKEKSGQELKDIYQYSYLSSIGLY